MCQYLLVDNTVALFNINSYCQLLVRLSLLSYYVRQQFLPLLLKAVCRAFPLLFSKRRADSPSSFRSPLLVRELLQLRPQEH